MPTYDKDVVALDPRTGLLSFPKNVDVKLSAHFGTREFRCPCKFKTCQTQFVHTDLLNKLDQLRDAIGASIQINSGYRCQAHQLELIQGGYPASLGTSQHTLGHAADITSPEFVQLAAHAPNYFTAIGMAHTWMHVDTRAGAHHWSY